MPKKTALCARTTRTRMRVGAPTKTEREARGGNLGNCETMEDADVLALDGAGGRRTAVWTKHEALPPGSSAWNIALGRKTISDRWQRDVARVSFLLLTSSVSSTFHQGRIESSRERSITPSRGPSIHLPVSLLSLSGRQVGLLRKREREESRQSLTRSLRWARAVCTHNP